MSQIQVCIDISEQTLRSFEAEAKREGVTLQSLLERMVNRWLQEMEREDEEGTDLPIVTS